VRSGGRGRLSSGELFVQRAQDRSGFRLTQVDALDLDVRIKRET
jgi:hypothetical protein